MKQITKLFPCLVVLIHMVLSGGFGIHTVAAIGLGSEHLVDLWQDQSTGNYLQWYFFKKSKQKITKHLTKIHIYTKFPNSIPPLISRIIFIASIIQLHRKHNVATGKNGVSSLQIDIFGKPFSDPGLDFHSIPLLIPP